MLSEKPWKLDAVVQLLMGLLVCMSVGVLVSQLATPWLAGLGGDQRFYSFLINALSLHGSALVFFVFFLREHEITWGTAFGFSTPGKLRFAGIALLAGLGALPVAWLLGQMSAWAMERVHVTPQAQQTVQTLQTSVTPATQAGFALVAVVIAPFVEEVLFRGILYPTVKQMGRPRLALWGTALLFGVIHFNAMTFLSLVFLSVVLTLLYEKTDNLLAPILTHGFFNVVNFVFVVNERSISRWLDGLI